MKDAQLLAEAINDYIRSGTGRRKRDRTNAIESRLEATMVKTFRRQGALLVRFLEHSRALHAKTKVVTEDAFPNWLAEWLEVVRLTRRGMQAAIGRTVEDAFEEGAEQAALELPQDLVGAFTLKNPRAVAYLRDHAAQRVSSIDEATRSEIGSIVTKGVEDGQSYDAIARLIKQRFSDFAMPEPQLHIRSRAHLVAVTETADGYEAGNIAVARTLADRGLAMEKAWLTAEDDRVDDTCFGNEQGDWIPLEESFASGDDRPPAHPGCRCALLTRLAKEEA